MKKTINLICGIISICFALSIVSCEKESNETTQTNIHVTQAELTLNLTSPNGIQIAKDVKTLKMETSILLCQNNGGIDTDFEIIYINYISVEKGYAAIIEYQLISGVKGSYVKASKDSSLELMAKTKILKNISTKPKTRTEDDYPRPGDYKITCSDGCVDTKTTCSTTNMDHNGGTLPPNQVSCSCTDCTMVVTYD